MNENALTPATNSNWWRGGVIYQIYPRSYGDSNGDGIGDLPGITARLDYVASLGVDAIWLSPFFKSPMKDFGYDVSDYCDVDPMFGTLDDFRALLDKAHRLGLKVMIDQVLSHTSDVHPWFVESRSSRDNAKADWYVWADAKDDGTPPNNWLSIFGGSAWQWDTRRRQYYLHNFLASQPDLNFHNKAVQDALLTTVKFWLDLGVDGYRLDTANFYFHSQSLKDNPPRGMPQGEDPAVNSVNPYAWQWHHYDKSQPENLAFLRRLRTLLNAYPDTTMVGEIGDDDGLARVAEYTSGGDKLHMAYCFDLLGGVHDAPGLHAIFSRFHSLGGDSWPSWALSNHDCVRVGSRWRGADTPVALKRLGGALQLALMGSPCLYQGDELGLPEADIAFEDLQDPYGITMWPDFKGRDGCRTPMPWSAQAPHAGFGTPAATAPWLPVAQPHLALAVDQQEGDPASVLSTYRRLLHWRKQQPALLHGAETLLPVHPQVLGLVREAPQQKLLALFNFSDAPASLPLPAGWEAARIVQQSEPTEAVRLEGTTVQLPAWSGVFLTV
ncbi:alpha-amylase family glycosyl hydrolase [Amphibiibacter pelophylacis]|uniref:Alpha-amylase family glycosyl hydrolase n=1 Tax=Amphibiibacter pelophylacis TaxID=1799477 RepID=A0ACC6NYH9_9BURK